MEDIAILTGGTFISEDLGIKLENVDLDELGPGEEGRHHQGRDHHHRGRRSHARPSRAASSRSAAQIEDTDSNYDREKLQERLAKLAGGVAVIKVGAATETELKEKKHRFEDALSAARAAVEEGIVPGGGVTYINVAPALEKVRKDVRGDEKVGVDIVRRALEEPLRTDRRERRPGRLRRRRAGQGARSRASASTPSPSRSRTW